MIPEFVAETSGLTKEQITELVQQAYDRRMKAGRANSDPGSGYSLNSGRSKRSSLFTYQCPEQIDQSKVYRLGSDPTGYPVQPISDELFLRSLPGSDTFFQCLSRQVLQPELNPTLEPQPLLEGGNVCPQVLSQLWTYNSVVYGNQLCWVLANFQEDILFNQKCSGVPCKGCDSFFHTSFGDIRKVCLPLFRTVSLWAFCPGLPQNARLFGQRCIMDLTRQANARRGPSQGLFGGASKLIFLFILTSESDSPVHNAD
ncbi:hypothetical protein PoB_005889000 [Plakobranchus ocellatus]|uniref:Uncharacterized protein n=1 Tax=Plakobranchus ocellatus TaxID=259542 RepID=A0AAV4CL23_9GAST|nr:hypothetical protein PoB_005889000 [Plakobranchus ocellatus]